MRTFFAAALAALTLSAPAHADTLTLSTSPDPAEDRPVTVYADIGSETAFSVYARARPAGGAPCGTTWTADARPLQDDVLLGWDGEETGHAAESTWFSDPGDHVVCAWLEEWLPDAPAAASAALVVHVRSNAATAALATPRSIGPRASLRWTATVSTEVPRRVFVALRPALARGDDRACGRSYGSRVGSFDDAAYARDVQGTQSLSGVVPARDLEDGTRQLVCVWVQEAAGDARAEAQASAFVWVRAPRRA